MLFDLNESPSNSSYHEVCLILNQKELYQTEMESEAFWENSHCIEGCATDTNHLLFLWSSRSLGQNKPAENISGYDKDRDQGIKTWGGAGGKVHN